MAELGAPRRDGIVMPHLDLLGERHPRGIGDDGVAELIDEAIALDEQRGNAKREVQLR
jgi:hypothetical protein